MIISLTEADYLSVSLNVPSWLSELLYCQIAAGAPKLSTENFNFAYELVSAILQYFLRLAIIKHINLY